MTLATPREAPAPDWEKEDLLALHLRRLRLLLQRQGAGQDLAPIEDEIVRIEEHLAQRAQRLLDEGTPHPLDVLAYVFRLNAFERDLLLLAFAPEADPSFERLYAQHHQDPARRHATLHLARQVLWRASDPPAHEALLPDAPLRRHRLVRVDPAPSGVPHAARPIVVEERVVDYLQGTNRPDERVRRILSPLEPPLPLHDERAQRLTDGLHEASRRGPWPLLQIWGPRGCGRHALAAEVCHRLGLTPQRLRARELPADPAEREEILRVLERDAMLLRLGLVLDDEEAEGAHAAAFEQACEDLGVLTLVLSRQRRASRRPSLGAELPSTTPAQRAGLWRDAVERHRIALPPQALDSLAHQFDLGPSGVAQAVASAPARARLRGPTAPPTPQDLWEAAREQAGRRMDDLAQRIVPAYDWDDIVLPPDTARQLRDVAEQVAKRPLVYDQWGFGRKLPRGRGVTALFAGPSGTGKTMAAEVLAAHLGLDLHRVDLSGIMSKYIGETEKNLRRVFSLANGVLFFDEADALFGKRGEVRDSHDRYANVEINYLLQKMEEYPGIAILATNRRGDLDNAFLRRLRFVLDFPMPDAAQRRLLWEKSFPSDAPLRDLDFDRLSHLDLSGGNIRTIALNAAFLAAAEGSPIAMPHVAEAVRREMAKLERMVPHDWKEGDA